MPQVTPIAGMPCAWAATMSNERSPTITARVGPSSRSARRERLGLVLGACVELRAGDDLEVLAQPHRLQQRLGERGRLGGRDREPVAVERSSASGMPGSTVVSVSDAVS